MLAVQAVSAYEEMKAADAEAIRGIRSSASLAVLVSCAYKGFAKLALNVLDDLHESKGKVSLDGAMYSLAMQACTKGQDFKGVIKASLLI